MNKEPSTPKPVPNSRLHEDDPELEREYRMLAQLLIDIYIDKKKKEEQPQSE